MTQPGATPVPPGGSAPRTMAGDPAEATEVASVAADFALVGTSADPGLSAFGVVSALRTTAGGPTCAPTDFEGARRAGLPRIDAVKGYEILDELGRGGMGVVYKARQLGLDRTVALKMILSGAHASDLSVRRFRAEATAVGRIQHPNIIQIYEIDEHDGQPFFSLEFAPGGSLARRVEGTPWAARDAALMVEALARAISAAHREGILHRDLKPANVLLMADGTPKVADFGLAKFLGSEGPTSSGIMLGTPSYMAPEQAMGE